MAVLEHGGEFETAGVDVGKGQAFFVEDEKFTRAIDCEKHGEKFAQGGRRRAECREHGAADGGGSNGQRPACSGDAADDGIE